MVAASTPRLRLILGDQLSSDLSSIQALDPQRDILDEVKYCSERCRRARRSAVGEDTQAGC